MKNIDITHIKKIIQLIWVTSSLYYEHDNYSQPMCDILLNTTHEILKIFKRVRENSNETIQ